MRLHRLFDELEDPFGLADKKDVAVPGRADAQRVMSLTHKKLGMTSKKALNKKVIFSLLAAAIVIGSSVFGVSGIIRQKTADMVFSDVFSGEPNAAGLYESSSVSFNSSDSNLHAEVLGMTADDQNLYSMICVSYKDGRAFSEDGYIYGLYTPGGKSFDDLGCTVKCTQRDGDPLGASGMGGGFGCRYFLSDDRKTMKIYLRLDTDGLDASGGKLTFISRRFAAQKITEIKETLDTVITQDYIDRQEMLEKEKYHIVRIGNKYAVCSTETKEFELPFEITFSLDYSVGNNLWLHPKRSTVTDILMPNASEMTAVISGFGISLHTSTSPKAAGIGEPESDIEMFVCFRDIDSADSKVVLDDGTVYYPVLNASSSGMNESANRFEETVRLQYKTVPSPAFEDEVIIVDTAKIRQIIINGAIIYEKGDDNNVGKADTH